MIMLCRKLEFQLAGDILFSPLLKEHELYPSLLESCAGRSNRDLIWDKNVGEIQVVIMFCTRQQFN